MTSLAEVVKSSNSSTVGVEKVPRTSGTSGGSSLRVGLHSVCLDIVMKPVSDLNSAVRNQEIH